MYGLDCVQQGTARNWEQFQIQFLNYSTFEVYFRQNHWPNVHNHWPCQAKGRQSFFLASEMKSGNPNKRAHACAMFWFCFTLSHAQLKASCLILTAVFIFSYTPNVDTSSSNCCSFPHPDFTQILFLFSSSLLASRLHFSISCLSVPRSWS